MVICVYVYSVYRRYVGFQKSDSLWNDPSKEIDLFNNALWSGALTACTCGSVKTLACSWNSRGLQKLLVRAIRSQIQTEERRAKVLRNNLIQHQEKIVFGASRLRGKCEGISFADQTCQLGTQRTHPRMNTVNEENCFLNSTPVEFGFTHTPHTCALRIAEASTSLCYCANFFGDPCNNETRYSAHNDWDDAQISFILSKCTDVVVTQTFGIVNFLCLKNCKILDQICR